MKQLLNKKLVLFLAFALVLGLFINSISAEENNNLINSERSISSEVSIDPSIDQDVIEDYKENSDIPDIYGTSPETTFTFDVNGETIQAGESIYIYSSPDMQEPIISTDENLEGFLERQKDLLKQ